MTQRTPLSTTKRVPRKVGGQKQVCLYEKTTTLKLTGEPSELQKVMADLHAHLHSHPLVTGGKTKRKVHVTYTSNEPSKIFDGVI